VGALVAKNRLDAFSAEESGVTAISYGFLAVLILAVLIMVAMIAAATLLGNKVRGIFDTIAANVSAALER